VNEPLDGLERLCVSAHPETITVGAQDPDVGWPETSKPGYWITVDGTSYIAPTLADCIQSALIDRGLIVKGESS
jgi:hypothetical protein